MNRVLPVLGLAFTGYLVARGMFWTAPLRQPLVFVLAMVLYVGVTWLCVLWGDSLRSRPTTGSVGRRLPLWPCVLAVSTALALPPTVALGVGPDAVGASYSTWFIGGLGALAVVLVVRARAGTAWIVTGALAVWSAVLLGPMRAFGLGLVGSIMWVLAAQFMVYALGRADRDTRRLEEVQRTAIAVQAAQSGRQRERRIQVQRALAVAGPVLARTIATGGRLGEEGRLAAKVAEGALRDELRGPRLLDDAVREALDAVRRRGAVVTVLDDGGLEGTPEHQLDLIRAELAETLGEAYSERLYIRTSPDAEIAVTVVGRAGSSSGLSDDDDVDLWHEIRRPAASDSPHAHGRE